MYEITFIGKPSATIAYKKQGK